MRHSAKAKKNAASGLLRWNCAHKLAHGCLKAHRRLDTAHGAPTFATTTRVALASFAALKLVLRAACWGALQKFLEPNIVADKAARL